MKFLGIKSIVIKKYKPTSSSIKSDKKSRPNKLTQNFESNKPGTKLLGDITYIWTKEYGWTYLAIVLDLYDLKVIGWEYGLKMDEELVINAMKKAAASRQLYRDGLFHSDQGGQYTSINFENLLELLGIKHSYSKAGCPYDNASMESFNAILKKEEVNLKTYCTFDDAKLAIFEFIESWYNIKRIHGTLGYISPKQKYDNYLANNNHVFQTSVS